MAEKETAINPKPIISLMFAISVGFWASKLAQYFEDETKSLVILISGILFLMDLLCIVWWYAKYIYRVQSKASFGTYSLDFVICSMFALASNSWTKPHTFLLATACGSAFLVCRFVLLYFSSDASLTDKHILSMAGVGLAGALSFALVSLAMFDRFSNNNIFMPALPGVLSAIGIILTLCMRKKIDVAVAIYLAKHAPVTPAHLSWPASKSHDVEKQEVQQQHARIRHRTQDGLQNFDDLFRKFGKHDRIYSRVHSETQLRVQSYILAMPSCENEDCAEEIEKKAFMVAVSHWLDDLVDGRNELFVWKQLQNGTPLSDKKEEAERLFRQIYRPLIVKYTDRKFYDRLYDKICEACPLPYNLKYILLGLNRVAYGSVIFSPKLAPVQRRCVLDDHNVFLKDWNVEGVGKDFENEVENILDHIAVGDDAGPILLGLTTKTVQEVTFSSESCALNVGLSILFSILYAPLIYYHNIIQELKNGEMIPLQAFDTDSDLWIPWLKRTRKAIDTFGYSDERKQIRIKQIEMAYRCFEPMLPEFIRPELAKIYLREPEDVSPTS